MARGALFVMFHQTDPPLTLEAARGSLTHLSDSQVRFQAPFMVVHDDNEEADVLVALNDDDYVLEENAEILADAAAARPDAAWLLGCDARMEIGWDLQEVDLYMGMVEYLRGEFEKLCRGVTWDAVNGEVMELS